MKNPQGQGADLFETHKCQGLELFRLAAQFNPKVRYTLLDCARGHEKRRNRPAGMERLRRHSLEYRARLNVELRHGGQRDRLDLRGIAG